MRHLKLVGVPEPAKPKRRKYERIPLLTDDEERRFRSSMRGLRDAFGSWECLGVAMGAKHKSLVPMMAGRVRVSGEMVLRAMRASGLSYDDLMGTPKLAGTCRACGAVKRAS